MMSRTRIALTDEAGQTMAEYAFVLSILIVGVILALGVLSGAVAASIDNAASLVKSLS